MPACTGRSRSSCWSGAPGSATPRCAGWVGSRVPADPDGRPGVSRRVGRPARAHTGGLSSTFALEPTMTSEAPFDPTAPLAGPPDPWEGAPTPSTRNGPPYHMTDMIAAEPALGRRIAERLAVTGGTAAQLAETIRATLEAGEPVVLTGCGTSEHAALAAAEILREAARAAGLADPIVTVARALALSVAAPDRAP